MPSNAIPYRDQFADESASLREKLSDSAEHVKGKAADYGRQAVETIDSNRDAAASGLQRAATALHEKASSLPGGESVSGMARATADTLSSTAEYVRDHDVKRMMSDLTVVVKNNPGPSLLAAICIGFLVGRAFNGNRD